MSIISQEKCNVSRKSSKLSLVSVNNKIVSNRSFSFSNQIMRDIVYLDGLRKPSRLKRLRYEKESLCAGLSFFTPNSRLYK